ncbi:MAG: thiol:disulfide interchange protein DsbA/DsbL [Pseudomonadota bacterium]
MNRREFAAGTACLMATAALGIAGPVFAQGKKPEDGGDFISLDRRVPVDAPEGRIEVIEFFWYGCPHCNAFEPRLVSWIQRQQPDVAVRRIPAAFRDDMVPQQRLFYALEAMGKVEELHDKVFRAIHEERNPLNREALIVDWVGKQGVDPAKFRELYNSLGVLSKARRAVQIQDAYKVQGVPAIGVAGRFYTDAALAGSMDRALQVTDYLVAETRKSR